MGGGNRGCCASKGMLAQADLYRETARGLKRYDLGGIFALEEGKVGGSVPPSSSQRYYLEHSSVPLQRDLH